MYEHAFGCGHRKVHHDDQSVGLKGEMPQSDALEQNLTAREG